MIQYDSKLFYGTELGPLTDIIKRLDTIIPKPPHKPIDNIDAIGWINTQLPKGIFLETMYPYRDCDPNEMVAHLNLLDDSRDDSITYKNMKKLLKRANYTGYANILGRLGMDYKEPVFYIQTYVYNNLFSVVKTNK
jgi:hypothetical protein